jgi:hypothetical protein
MITKTKLPGWLNEHLFHSLKAMYAPNPQAVERSFGFDPGLLRTYLGTYFPRSYAETFCIFSALFENKHIAQRLSQCVPLRILVIGAGTGGDTAGLLTALHKHLPGIREIDLTAYDGNRYALTFCDSIIRTLKSEHTITITWRPHLWNFIENGFPKIEKAYDVILTSKMLNEIMHQGYRRPYYDFAKICLPMLTESGICAMIDVTIPIEDQFIPKLMNNQINEALSDLASEGEMFATLLPELCRKSTPDCQCDFVSYQFSVRYFIDPIRLITNKSQVIYRVLAREILATTAQVTTTTSWFKKPKPLSCETM